jgi:hypothetical protein
MPSFIKNLTFDCADALRVARFWAAALSSDVDEESTADRAYVEAPGWGGPNIWFRGGRDPKAAPNRVHPTSRSTSASMLVSARGQRVLRRARAGGPPPGLGPLRHGQRGRSRRPGRAARSPVQRWRSSSSCFQRQWRSPHGG